MNASEHFYQSSENRLPLYDGADEVEKNWGRALSPDSYHPVSEWADKYRILSSKSAAEPGRWRTSRTPYLKEIMDCLSPHSAIQKVVFMKGAQIGGTECGNNWIGYVIHQAPGPMMAVSPTVEMAKRNSRQRIDPLIEDCPILRGFVKPARSRDSGNTVLSKEFAGGLLVMTGANSAVGLRSMPARYLFMDEIDGYPRDLDGEGDPIFLAERRTSTFQRQKKILLVSTPTIKGLSNIERAFENSDKRFYLVPCPFCGTFQRLVWNNIKVGDDDRHCSRGLHENGKSAKGQDSSGFEPSGIEHARQQKRAEDCSFAPCLEDAAKIAPGVVERAERRKAYADARSPSQERFLHRTVSAKPAGAVPTVRYECAHCHDLIDEHYKTQMLAAGRWETTALGDGTTAGFHISSLYSPVGWLSWRECVDIYNKAKDDNNLMQGFQNTILGETFEQANDAPEWQLLYALREQYPIGVVPMGGLFLTVGVDIQKDRIECEIVAWGRFKQSWSVDYIVLSGDTARPDVWRQLDAILQKDYPHASGITMPIRVMCVDSGYATQDVYNFVKHYPQATWGGNGARANTPRTVVAIKGQSRDTAMILSTSKADTKKKGIKVWNVSGPIIKTELYRWLKMNRVGEDMSSFGWCHFPSYDEEYFKQLTSEKLVIRIHKGYPHPVWEKDPNVRNEALDARVYARAGAAIYGLDRFGDKQWEELEALIPNASQTVRKKPLALFEPIKPTRIDDPWL